MKKNSIQIEGDNPHRPDSVDVSLFEGISAPQAQVGIQLSRAYCYVFIKDSRKVREIAMALLEVANQMEVINNPVKIEM